MLNHKDKKKKNLEKIYTRRKKSASEAVVPLDGKGVKEDGEMAEKLNHIFLLCLLWKTWGMYLCNRPYFQEGNLRN